MRPSGKPRYSRFTGLRIFSFGLNSYGQLGVSSGDVREEDMDVGRMHFPFISLLDYVSTSVLSNT